MAHSIIKLESSAAGFRDPVRLDFRDLNYTVATPQGEKHILKDASGAATPGRLLAMMGRSGAGKTTLLDTLAAVSTGGRLRGEVLVNGVQRNVSQFRRISCYVMQKDVLLSTATVREALMTSAQLRLPYAMSNTDKAMLVTNIIEELGLQACADTLAGDEVSGIKGISGGERRRTSMALELVTDPSIIFLDEPTSGLDSDTAMSVVAAMQHLARRNRTVICTIHQPGSDIVDMFDDLILLAGGRVAYHGTFQGAVSFIGEAGYPCPPFKNPADFFMSLFREEANATNVCDAWARYTTTHGTVIHRENGQRDSIVAVSSSAADTAPSIARDDVHMIGGRTAATDPLAECDDVRAADSGRATPHWQGNAAAAQHAVPAAPGSLPAPPRPPIWYQTLVLTQRFRRTYYRNPALLASQLFQYVFFAISIGLMYLNIPSSIKDDAVFLRSSSLWFVLAAMCFTPPMTAATAWDQERVLLKREHAVNAYHSAAFYLGKTLTTWPFEVFQTIVFCAVLYFMVGYQATAAAFFTFVAIVVVFQLISETIGVLCATLTSSSMYAIILATVVLFYMLAFNGFLIPKTPIYFVWLQKISYLNFAFVSLIDNEFTGLTFKDLDGSRVSGGDLIPSSAKNGFSVATNIVIMLCILLGCRVLGYVQLLLALKWRWL